MEAGAEGGDNEREKVICVLYGKSGDRGSI